MDILLFIVALIALSMGNEMVAGLAVVGMILVA